MLNIVERMGMFQTNVVERERKKGKYILYAQYIFLNRFAKEIMCKNRAVRLATDDSIRLCAAHSL